MKKSSRLPDLRNLGVNLRLLMIVNSMLVLGAVLLSSNFWQFFSVFTSALAIALPMLLLSLLGLYLAYPLLIKLTYWQGLVAIIGIVLLSCSSIYALISQLVLLNELLFNELPTQSRVLFFALILTAITLYYFNLHYRAYSPALSEARLQALQARIRPHFLFNSINAVLSLIRSRPKQAETALEDMADLFRVLMADNRDLVPLAQEIALCRQYLALEKLRLDERLYITWQIDNMPPDALIPPLLLQPLLENAVYHGIEPLAIGGTITIQIYTKSKEVHLVISNPYNAQKVHQAGNKMALSNIKERLMLHFDLEASLKSTQSNSEYQVHITLPYTQK